MSSQSTLFTIRQAGWGLDDTDLDFSRSTLFTIQQAGWGLRVHFAIQLLIAESREATQDPTRLVRVGE
jgi:hypothetical protein